VVTRPRWARAKLESWAAHVAAGWDVDATPFMSRSRARCRCLGLYPNQMPDRHRRARAWRCMSWSGHPVSSLPVPLCCASARAWSAVVCCRMHHCGPVASWVWQPGQTSGLWIARPGGATIGLARRAGSASNMPASRCLLPRLNDGRKPASHPGAISRHGLRDTRILGPPHRALFLCLRLNATTPVADRANFPAASPPASA